MTEATERSDEDGAAAGAGAPSAGVHSGATAIHLKGISKSYPGVDALVDVDLVIDKSEIHGLVGENGAGKSTLLKILSGAHEPTAGTIELFGEEIELKDPSHAKRLGITAVYQELTIIPSLSAAANVFLGQEKRTGPLQARAAEQKRFRELCDTLGVNIQPSARAETLSIADQQALEIMRGIESAARILVLDEPTASLALHEREAVYKTVRSLSSHGVTIVLISHDLDEVFRLCDTVTVLRDGRKVASRPVKEWDTTGVIEAMLGANVSLKVTHRRKAGRELLRAEDVEVPGVLTGVSLNVRAGEILGIAGLVGSGRTELLRALAGLDSESTGKLWIDGDEARWPRSPRAALKLGIALAPEDRKAEGLILQLPAYDNINMTAFATVSIGPVLLRSREVDRAEVIGTRVKLQKGAVRRQTRLLSGGNQQKLVLAKWIDRETRVLLVDEPARGIDIGATAEVFSLLDQLASSGMAVVMVSSELEEVVENCDRVIALANGSVVKEFEGLALTQARVMRSLFEGE